MRLVTRPADQLEGISDAEGAGTVAAVLQVHEFHGVHVCAAAVVEHVPPQQVFLAGHQLVVKQEERPLLALALPGDPGQLPGVDQLRAALEDVLALEGRVDTGPEVPRHEVLGYRASGGAGRGGPGTNRHGRASYTRPTRRARPQRPVRPRPSASLGRKTLLSFPYSMGKCD